MEGGESAQQTTRRPKKRTLDAFFLDQSALVQFLRYLYGPLDHLLSLLCCDAPGSWQLPSVSLPEQSPRHFDPLHLRCGILLVGKIS